MNDSPPLIGRLLFLLILEVIKSDQDRNENVSVTPAGWLALQGVSQGTSCEDTRSQMSPSTRSIQGE